MASKLQIFIYNLSKNATNVYLRFQNTEQINLQKVMRKVQNSGGNERREKRKKKKYRRKIFSLKCLSVTTMLKSRPLVGSCMLKSARIFYVLLYSFKYVFIISIIERTITE